MKMENKKYSKTCFAVKNDIAGRWKDNYVREFYSIYGQYTTTSIGISCIYHSR